MDMREMAALAYPTFNLADSGSFVGRELGVSEWITICLLYTSDAADE